MHSSSDLPGIGNTAPRIFFSLFCCSLGVKIHDYGQLCAVFIYNYIKCKCNLFTHKVPRSSRNSFKGVRAFQVELEFVNVVFCGGRNTGEPGEKPSEQ